MASKVQVRTAGDGTTRAVIEPDVIVEEDKIIIKGLIVNDLDIVDYVRGKSDKAAAIFDALKLGVRVLRLAETSGDVEMVKREFDRMTTTIGNSVDEVLSDTQNKLSKRLTEFNSQELEGTLSKHRRELNDELARLFGPESAASVQKQVEKTLQQQAEFYTQGLKKVVEPSDDPENPFNKLRKDVVNEVTKTLSETKGLRDEVMKIIGEAKGIASEREKGHTKGLSYQLYAHQEIDRIARIFGDTAVYVGDQPGEKGKKTGDTVVEISSKETSGAVVRVVFEAKNQKQIAGPAIMRELDEAKENRVAIAAVAVFGGPEDVPGTLRTWRDYAGNRYICVLREEEPDPFALEFSYRCARFEAIHSIEPDQVKLDTAAIKDVLKRMSGKLADFQQMQSNLTSARGSIDKVGDLIETHKSAMRHDLDEIDRLFVIGQ